jgi:hypothetical protein
MSSWFGFVVYWWMKYRRSVGGALCMWNAGFINMRWKKLHSQMPLLGGGEEGGGGVTE